MKARNNISSYFDFADDDVDRHSDEEFTTPVKRGKNNKNTPVAPIKASHDVKHEQPSFSPVKFSFENIDSPVKSPQYFDGPDSIFRTPTKSVSVSNLPDAPKKTLTQNNFSSTSLPEAPNFNDAPKRRRNLDALGSDIKDDKEKEVHKESKRRVNDSDSYTKSRDVSELEQKILNSEVGSQNSNPFEKITKKPAWGKKEKHFVPTFVAPEPEVKKPDVVNMEDPDLFPTLGNLKETKKVSVWSVFNPNLMMSSSTKQVVISAPKIQPKTINKPIVMNDNQYSENENSDDENDDDYHDDESYSEYEEMEEDSEAIYWREIYEKRDQLIDDIRFVKRNLDRYNVQHIRFLRQMQTELADIEDEIYRNESLNNELEQIYGPSYFNYPSLYDEMKEKRDRENRENKSKQSTEEFLKSINSCLLQTV